MDNKTFVTDGVRYLVKLPAMNPWGFVLADEEQAWPGGLDSGLTHWHPVAVAQVPAVIRQRLEWILEEDE